jgi:DNA-binding CsgD family transcriptional regulator/tetratricopeptide (TPR) repeat protein
VESQLVPSEAARLHRRYAELLDADRTGDAAHRAVEAADHWWLAGDVGNARRAALVAADGAGALGLFREQWRLLSRVLQLPDVGTSRLGPAPDRVGLLHAAGRAACNSGEFTVGFDLLDSAARLLDLGRDAAQALEILSDLVTNLVGTAPKGVDDGVEAAVRTALAALPEQPSRPRMLGNWALAQFHLHRGERPEAWDSLHEAIACAETIGDPLRAASLRVHLAAYFAASWIPGDEGRRLYAGARRLAREHADHQLERVSLINEVDLLVAGVGKYAEATRVAREMLTVVENYAAPARASDIVVGNAAEALLATGGWAEALDRLTAALEVDRPSVEHGTLYMLLAAVSLALGDLAGAGAAAAEARQRFSGGGTAPQHLVAHAAVEAELALVSGRPTEAFLVAAGAFDAHRGHVWPSRLCELADVAARANRRLPPDHQHNAWLRFAVERFRRDTSDGALPWWPPVLTAEISYDIGDWQAALRAITGAEVPVLVGLRTRIGAAHALLKAGRRDRGTALLRETADQAAALHARGITTDISDIAHHFRLPGFESPLPSPARLNQLGSLTPRELEVLRLVAAGHSNGRIAAELVISVKTASVHVSHILTKLSVATRGEAAALAWKNGLTLIEPRHR